MHRIRKPDSYVLYSSEKCLICWYMHHSAVHHIANILIAGRSRGFSVMGYSAESVPLGVVYFVRRCGIFFSFTRELAKNLNAMCHDAGI